MDCPVCKYPNTAGATHCGMCYEVFNRSAAQAYMHAVKRERREKEGVPDDPQAIIQSEKVVVETPSVISQIDWQALSGHTVSLLRKFKAVFFVAGGLILLWMLVSFLIDPSLWYHLLGKKFVYAFSGKAPTQYLVGMKQEIKIWSERQGRLDTPMETFKIEEMGNILIEKKGGAAKNQGEFGVQSREWIQILNDNAGSASRTIPKNHPSLVGARVIFDKKGVLEQRRYALSPRLAKSLPFLTPRFPKGKLKRGHTWNENVEWLDVYSDWKIHWAGTLHWTLGDLEPCGSNTCAKLTYTADLRTKLQGAPSWAAGAVRRADATVATEGVALFDASHKRLVSNVFSYDGLLRIPITDLTRIPWELRVGRRVKGAGDIVIRFENKIDLHQN